MHDADPTIRARLAPSPTGVLHLGNARSFLLAWLWARARGGQVQLRIEDIDGPRTKEGATESALADLLWLGLDWDGDVVMQSQRLEVYSGVAEQLLERGLAYPCVCTRKEVEAAASAPHEAWMDAQPYPGTCRGRFASMDEARARSGREPALRFAVSADSVPFDDAYRGPEPGRIAGDFVIQKRDGGPAYQLAVVVDDAEFGITEVLRGDDLLASTPRQLLLYDAIGQSPPVFAHVPLVVGKDGRRLAKRHGDTSLAHFRDGGFCEGGIEADQVVGYLAFASGLLPELRRCSAGELLDVWSARGADCLRRVPREPLVGDRPTFPSE